MSTHAAAGPHLGQRVELLMSAKLGRCWRCMTWSATLFVAGWSLVVWLALLDATPRVIVVLATILVTPITALALAHAIAYAAIRRTRATSGSGDEETGVPAVGAPQRRGCNCGGRRIDESQGLPALSGQG